MKQKQTLYREVLRLVSKFDNDSNVRHCLGESGHYECGEMDRFTQWLEEELCYHKFVRVGGENGHDQCKYCGVRASRRKR